MNIETRTKGSPEPLGQRLETIWPDEHGDFPPRQPSVELERLSRKQRLAAGYRLFSRFGFDMGGAGHITVRDPELTDHFWVNPASVHFSHITVSDLMLVSHKGEIVEPPARARPMLNRAAFAIHSTLHAARPDVNAAAHSHSMYGKAFSALGRPLAPISQDAAAFYQDHAIYGSFSGVVLDLEEGKSIGRTLGDGHSVILKNHGLLTVSQTIDGAIWRYLAMENACKTQLIAEAAGPLDPMPHDVAVHTQGQVGGETMVWYAFQPYWDWIVDLEPDLLG